MRLICLECDFEAYSKEDIPELVDHLRKLSQKHVNQTGHLVISIAYSEQYKKFKEFVKLMKIRDNAERINEMVRWLNKGMFSRVEILLDYIDHLESMLKQR